MLKPPLRLRIATALEDGRVRDAFVVGPLARTLARGVAPLAARRIARRLVAPPSVRLVTVGGATLGGSGRTRLALAVVLDLARRAVPVALVGHGYRAQPGRARSVSPEDPLDEVGDEARACARALASFAHAEVVVAPRRAEAVALAAARGARVVVLDGPLRTRPAVPDLALLAVDPQSPWGAGLVLPAGDLRAPPEALLAAADHRVDVAADPTSATLVTAREVGTTLPLASFAARVRSEGGRLGLFTALARPDRLARALGRAGVVPDEVVRVGDHGPLDADARARLARAAEDRNVTTWLASSKCSEHLRALAEAGALTLAVLDDPFVLPLPVAADVARLVEAISAHTCAHKHALTLSDEAP